MNDSIVVRVAKASDAQAAGALLKLAADDFVASDTTYRVRGDVDWAAYVRAQTGSPSHAILVARLGSSEQISAFIEVRIVGARRLRPVPWWRRLARTKRGASEAALVERNEVTGYISNVFVVPEMRRREVRMSLLKAASDWFEQAGIEVVEASVVDSNAASLALFEQNGFAPARRVLRKRLDRRAAG